MKKTRKFTVRERGLDEDFFMISEQSKHDISPLFCNVCSFVMNRSEDTESYNRFKCCYDCELKFAQSRSDDWLNGWRPKKEDIKSHKREIESRQQVLFFSHDN